MVRTCRACGEGGGQAVEHMGEGGAL